MTNIREEYMTKKEACAFLSISASALNRLLSRKEITYYKPLKEVWIKKVDLVKWFEASKVKSA